eukprot:GCRY01002688.1.p1 GENE.GCRY01002688.1~~GCRY01002688.1.p1  ORF type:complete len:200 (+),score=45.91 GCRY01002688.1:109-708(+)
MGNLDLEVLRKHISEIVHNEGDQAVLLTWKKLRGQLQNVLKVDLDDLKQEKDSIIAIFQEELSNFQNENSDSSEDEPIASVEQMKLANKKKEQQGENQKKRSSSQKMEGERKKQKTSTFTTIIAPSHTFDDCVCDWQIGNSKYYARIKKFRGQTYVDIRQFYEDSEGQLKPTPKGLMLNREQWELFRNSTDEVSKTFGF